MRLGIMQVASRSLTDEVAFTIYAGGVNVSDIDDVPML